MTLEERLTLIDTGIDVDDSTFASDVAAGLTAQPKHLPCRYFYDDAGSQLFEDITALPEYYLTRTEREILEARAPEVVARLPDDTTLVELGSGSSVKTRILIDAFLNRNGTLRYVPVDISRTILRKSAIALLEDYQTLHILAVAGDYDEGLREVERTEQCPKLILWLGSTIGNFDPPDAGQYLQRLHGLMRPPDRLLLGIDLQKDAGELEEAYNDAQGLTARFNLNLLTRINRELGGRFDLATFRHRAVYNADSGRVEMYLVSTRAQEVVIEQLGLTIAFDDEETVHTENSHKYSVDQILHLASASSFEVERQWFDARRRFSVNLLAPNGRQ